MSNITRRSLLRNGSAAASAAAVLSLGLPASAAAEGQAENVFHVFAFQWKQQATQADKEKATREINAFQGVIPGLSRLTSAPICLPEETDIPSAASCSSRIEPPSTPTSNIPPIRRSSPGSCL